MNTMRSDTGRALASLRVDGGACVSDFLMQFQSNLLGIPVDRPAMVETTALGAASLAGLAVGLWSSLDDIEACRTSERVFLPEITSARAGELFHGWHKAVEKAKNWIEP